MSTPIFAQLSSARRAIRQQAYGIALRRLVSAGTLAAVCAVFVWRKWPTIGPWALLCFLVGVLIYAAWPYVRLRKLWRTDHALARWIEQCKPAYRNDLSALLEFQERPPHNPTAMQLRTQVQARMQEALQRDSGSWDDILPLKDATRERRMAAAWVIVALIFVLTPWFRHAASPSPSKAEATETVQKLPVVLAIRHLDVHIEPPAYTGLPARTINNLTGGLRVQEGAKITLSGQLFQRVDQGWVAPKDSEDRTAMRVDDGFYFEAVIEATQDQTLTFGFDTRGNQIQDRMQLEVAVEPDEAPVVNLHEPKEDVHVTPGEVVELTYDVSDDFGLRDVHLVWHFAGQEEDAQRILLLDEASGTFAEDTAPFDTAPLYMQPGDEVIVYIEARDNVGFRPVNVGTSRELTLYIQEKQDFSEELLALKEALFEALLEQLGGILPTPLVEVRQDENQGFVLAPSAQDDASSNAEAIQNLGKTLQEDGAKVRAALVQLLELLGEMEHADAREVRLFETMSNEFEKSYTRLDQALTSIAPALEEPSLTADQTRRVGAQTIPLIEDLERAALLLSTLIQEHKAQDVARALEELSDIRARLKDLLQQYKETNDPEVRARIERELARLSRRMDELMRKIAAQVENLPQEHFNAEGIDPSDLQEQVSTMQDAMQKLRDSMAQGDADAAISAFEQLSQNLDALYQEMGDPTLNADQDTLSEFDRAMNEINDDISAIEAMQRAVEEETDRMQQELQEEKLQKHRQALEKQLERAQKIIQEAQEHLKQPVPKDDQASLQEATQSAQQALQTLKDIVDQRAFNQAEDSALDAMDALQNLRQESAKLQRYSTDKNSRDALQQLESTSRKDAAQMRELAKEFSEWQQRLTPEPGEERSDQLQSLQQRQQDAQKQLQSLQQKLSEVGEKFPTMKPGDEDSDFQRAEHGMQQSEQSLQQRQAQRAHQGQRQALDALGQMRQNMQQRMAQHRRQLQQQNEQSGQGRPRTEKVDVSKENSRDLRQRQQIMDAMREGRLEAWDDPIRQYYESLVR